MTKTVLLIFGIICGILGLIGYLIEQFSKLKTLYKKELNHQIILRNKQDDK